MVKKILIIKFLLVQSQDFHLKTKSYIHTTLLQVHTFTTVTHHYYYNEPIVMLCNLCKYINYYNAINFTFNKIEGRIQKKDSKIKTQ